ncbi:ABC transporter substrate-binding protein [Aerococcus sp. UMB1112A]|uniref:ABC transporter substrate-binding protein n=1 Tax=Aerococcus sp. UMB1112A TaxID=3050609 RepID=UPI002550C49D|nr:ABC transporter substrate-binding protein [Aerococcus sp. UMB1112A]MDK8502645.1 ABC transporter substrate-binding protein [Aerococcus sp. UMB1112A]
MKARIKKVLSFLGLVLFTVLVAGACQSTSESDQSSEADQASTESISQSTNDSDQVLRVVTTSERYTPFFDKFTEETGIPVEFLSMSSGEVLSRMEAEQGEPMADLWFGGGLDAFISAKDKGLLEQYQSEAVETLPEAYRDPDGYWLSKGLTVGGLLVNDQVLEELGIEKPTTWEDLTKPEYKDEIIMSDPAVSGTMYAIVKGLLDQKGESDGWAYWQAVDANIPFYGKRGKDPEEKTAAGEFAIGIVPIDASSFETAEKNGLSAIYPTDGIPWVPEGVAIFKGAANADAAKSFIDFMLKPENLSELSKLDGKDTAQTVNPNEVEALDLGLETNDLIEQDLSTFGSARDQILEKWAEMTKGKESK